MTDKQQTALEHIEQAHEVVIDPVNTSTGDVLVGVRGADILVDADGNERHITLSSLSALIARKHAEGRLR